MWYKWQSSQRFPSRDALLWIENKMGGKARKRSGDSLREMSALSPKMWCHTELKRANLPHRGLLWGKTTFEFMGVLMDCHHARAQTQRCRSWQRTALLQKDTKSLECGRDLQPGPAHVTPTLWGRSRKAQRQGSSHKTPWTPQLGVLNKSASLGWVVNDWGTANVLWIKMTGFTARTNHTVCEVRLWPIACYNYLTS